MGAGRRISQRAFFCPRQRDLVEALGARYYAGDAADIDADVDVVIECTGLGAVGRSAAQRVVSGGSMCLTGIMNVEAQFDMDATRLNRNMVLHNRVLFGTVNAGRRHREQAWTRSPLLTVHG